jgi:hypothetical protein
MREAADVHRTAFPPEFTELTRQFVIEVKTLIKKIARRLERGES